MENQTGTLKSKSVSGVKWNGAATGVITLLHFLTMALLARFLSPGDFGLIGMLMVIMGFAQTLVTMGISNAIIYRRDTTQDHLASLFWINMLTGLTLFIGLILISPLAALYFKRPDLQAYLIYAALAFLIMPVNQMYNAILSKALRFKALAVIEMSGMCVYTVITICLIFLNCGVYSLIFGHLIRLLFISAIFVVLYNSLWRPAVHFDFNEIKSYLSFGIFQMGERVVNYLYSNIDKFIIGRFLGSEALGFYFLAYQLILFPLTKINPVITRVAFPAFSTVQDDNALIRKGFCLMLKYISFISFPLLAGMFAVAPEFIRVAFGEKWSPAIPVLQLFCVIGVFWFVGNPAGPVVLAKGRADLSFYLNVLAFAITTFAVLVGVNWGITGVAALILILKFPLSLILIPLFKKLIGLDFKELVSPLRIPFTCALVMAAVLFFIRLFSRQVSDSILLGVMITIGAAIYMVASHLSDKTIFRELKSLILKE